MEPQVSLKAVFFDMDGVLVNVLNSYRRAIEETATYFTGRDIEAGTIQRYKDAGGFNDDWVLTQALISTTGIHVSFSRIVEEFQKRYRGENWDGFIAEEPALFDTKTLQKLQKTYRLLGLITGRPKDEACWTLGRFGWKALFPLVVAREEQEGRGKPDPYPLQRALTKLEIAGVRIQPEEAVYIGDTVDDMRAARAADMWAIGFIPPYVNRDVHAQRLLDNGAHLICYHSKDLPKVLTQLAHPVAVVG